MSLCLCWSVTKRKAAFESSWIQYGCELWLALISSLMVGLIWKSLFGQNWGRAASQLVPNNLANISLSVPVQLREQMRCLFTDRCNWKLRSAPNFALLQWTVLKKLCGLLAITEAAGQEMCAVELRQGNIQETSHRLLCCSQLQSSTSGGGSSTEQSIKMKCCFCLWC